MQHHHNSLFTFMAAAITLISLFLSITFTAEAQQNISLTSSLTPTGRNSSWLSRSGLYAFGFYPLQGSGGYGVGVFLAGIRERTVVWTANRDDPPLSGNVTLAFTDGNLVLKNQQEGQNPYIPTDISGPVSAASMLDTGNFVLYNSDHEIVWQSFDHPTDTILPGQPLRAGKELVSSASRTNHSTGIFRLVMQTDGHLLAVPVDALNRGQSDEFYASGTAGAGDNVTLNLNGDGQLYLLNATGVNIKNLTSGESSKEGYKLYMMKLDADGIFRVYSRTLDPNGNWSTRWYSSADQCNSKGLCGPNGYCVLNDNQPDCRCLPGFDHVDPEKWASGCERNFDAVSCKGTNGNTKYTMRTLENIACQEAPYSELDKSSREKCEEDCLNDCNCEAALYKNGQCKKQRLPLRYGRRSMDETQIAFIKMGTSEPEREPVVPPKEPPKESKKKGLGVEILTVSVSVISFVFMVLAILGALVYRNRVWAYKKIFEQGNVELGEDVAPRSFTFAELGQVTNGFQEELGRGAFGTVYKGIIPYNQKVVAVKKLEKLSTEGEREFQTEIKVIGRTHHRNLVRLIGYCLDGPNRLLVYQYMSNGSLADLLFSSENRPSWEERIGIARDIARGILYLHEECDTQIIHCDIKPQNILMDEHGCAKISDFGLAKLLKPDQTKTFTGIRGTRGYVAPEWHRKLPITVKADVYSFGVVLLEIICGRKCLEWSLGEEEAILEEWVYDCFEAGELGKLVGEEEVDKRKLERMVKVGLWCIQDDPSLRPPMKKVLLMLEGTVNIPVPPSPSSFLSAI